MENNASGSTILYLQLEITSTHRKCLSVIYLNTTVWRRGGVCVCSCHCVHLTKQHVGLAIVAYARLEHRIAILAWSKELGPLCLSCFATPTAENHVIGNRRTTVSRVLFRKRELTEFCGKLSEFCDNLGEFGLVQNRQLHASTIYVSPLRKLHEGRFPIKFWRRWRKLSTTATISQLKSAMRDIACRLKYEVYVYGKQHLTTCTEIPDTSVTNKHYQDDGSSRYVLLDDFGSGAERPWFELCVSQITQANQKPLMIVGDKMVCVCNPECTVGWKGSWALKFP